MVKCLPEIEYFTVILKNRYIFSKIRRSKVTDYAALSKVLNLHAHKYIHHIIIIGFLIDVQVEGHHSHQ